MYWPLASKLLLVSSQILSTVSGTDIQLFRDLDKHGLCLDAEGWVRKDIRSAIFSAAKRSISGGLIH